MSEDALADFRSVYEGHQAYVRKTLYWLVPRDQIDDLVQEVFVRAWQKRNQFQGQAELKTWLYRITVNIARDFHRRKNRLKRQVDETVPLSEPLSQPQDPLRDIIEAAISKLPEKQKEVFVLFYRLELSIEEISESIGIRAGTVKSRLYKARLDFTSQLKKEGVKL